MGMDFEVRYTEAQQQFRSEVVVWLDENIPEALLKNDEGFHVSYETYVDQRAFGRLLGARGWLFPTSPVQYGGGGLDLDSALVIMEELGKRGLSLPPYYDSGGVLGSVAILVWGSEEQKAALLPPIYKGEQRTWQLLTEPEAGSDLAGVRTTAVRDGDEYVLNGQKIFVGSDHGADAYWTLAKTDPDGERHQNLSWFMVPGGAPGLTVQPMHLIGGSDKNTVFFDNVRVPAMSLVGGENNGWKVASTHLDLEHGFRSDSILNYRGKQQWERLLQHCQAVDEDSNRRLDDPHVRELLAQAYIRFEIQRLWGLRNYWLSSATQERSYEGAQAYYFEKVTGMWLNRVAAEITGPAGLVWTPGLGVDAGQLGRGLAGTIGGSHGGGTIDIQRVVMARRLGIGRAQVEAAGTLA
jgi:3-oxocholest-4-en-26-oyl-CoA dehydrogenase alpha subunit